MNHKTKILVAGFVTLMVSGFGLLMFADTAQGIEKGRMRGFSKSDCIQWYGRIPTNKISFLENFGLPEDATQEQIRVAIWNKKISDLGLNENSTREEYRQALEAKRKSDHVERIQKLREKLGLSENATDEEFIAAMNKWRKENKELIGGPRHGPSNLFGADLV